MRMLVGIETQTCMDGQHHNTNNRQQQTAGAATVSVIPMSELKEKSTVVACGRLIGSCHSKLDCSNMGKHIPPTVSNSYANTAHQVKKKQLDDMDPNYDEISGVMTAITNVQLSCYLCSAPAHRCRCLHSNLIVG